MRIAALCLAGTLLLAREWPVSVVERTDYARTSTVAEVKAHMDELARLDPALKAYRPPGAPGATEAGKPLLGWRLAATGRDPLRVYINANIHAGEVEGKEAVQLLFRELLQGRHPGLRRDLELVTVPAYNADGTDAQDPRNRTHQPNPAGGVGPRENASGLDLNRDMMKAATANTRWVLAMYRDFDPACVLDLHTTNGSYHGFHLTHQASWGTGGDARLSTFNRRMLVEVQARLLKEGTPTYDYGNYTFDKDHNAVSWVTEFASPNILSNYPVLENRLGVLVEAYVYRSYKDRVQDTRAFVLAVLEWLAAHKDEVRAEQEGARRRWAEALKAGPRLPLRAELVETEKAPFDVVDPVKSATGQVLGEKSRTRVTLPSFVTYRGVDETPAPLGYLVDRACADRIRPLLEAHGLTVLSGTARPRGEAVLHFAETGRTVSAGAFQGVFTLALKGSWKPEPPAKRSAYAWTPEALDEALYVPVDQPLGRLAFYLLDPRAPDGLVFWGYFHSSILRGPGMWGDPPRFPILAVGDRCMDAPAGAAARPPEKHED
jgi:hypothetical protein